MEPTTTPAAATDLERRKIEIEEKKIEIEFDRIRIEKIKAWTGSLSTFASLLVVAGTIAIGIWSQYEQAKLQHDIQDRQAKAQFELKAAEIVMSTDNPDVTLNKAKAIQALFPQYLSTNFAESFVPQSFARPDEVANGGETDKITQVSDRKAPVNNRPSGGPVQDVSYVPGGKPKVYRPWNKPTPLPVDPYNPEAEGVAEKQTDERGKRYSTRNDVKKITPTPTPLPTPNR